MVDSLWCLTIITICRNRANTGKPTAPRQVTLTCSHTSSLAPFGRLQWQLGPYNNPPVEQAIIEYVSGTYRPQAPNLSHYRELLNHPGLQLPLNRHTKNVTSREQSLQNLWMQDTIPRAKQLAKKLIFTNRWSRIHPVPFSAIENHMARQQLVGKDRSTRMISLSTEVEQAFVRLHADVVYHFRVRLVNRIGQSEPSAIVPDLDGQSICHLPPEPATAVPNQMFVYGTQPHNLRIKFKVSLRPKYLIENFQDFIPLCKFINQIFVLYTSTFLYQCEK